MGATILRPGHFSRLRRALVVLVPLLVLELAPTAARGQGATESGAAPIPVEPPAPTQATFVSSNSEGWDVSIDGAAVCATPCQLSLQPVQFITLSSHEWNPVLLDVGRLPPGSLLVTGRPLVHGMYAGGVVATTLGGMALAIGITFTAVGLAKDRAGMTVAGLITGGAGALALPGGIYLMLRAVPGFTVTGAAPYTATIATRFP